MEAKRLKERVNFDIEMIKELGYCSGIENYSRFFDRRKPGSRPFCLIDYFPDDFLLVIDESHVTVPRSEPCMAATVPQDQPGGIRIQTPVCFGQQTAEL